MLFAKIRAIFIKPVLKTYLLSSFLITEIFWIDIYLTICITIFPIPVTCTHFVSIIVTGVGCFFAVFWNTEGFTIITIPVRKADLISIFSTCVMSIFIIIFIFAKLCAIISIIILNTFFRTITEAFYCIAIYAMWIAKFTIKILGANSLNRIAKITDIVNKIFCNWCR